MEKGKNECRKHGKKSEVNRQDPLVRRSHRPSLGRAVERGVVLLRREVDLARRVGGRRGDVSAPAAGGAAAGGARPAPRVHVLLGQELDGRMGMGPVSGPWASQKELRAKLNAS